MVRFLDGPAANVVLSLRRVPMFLRVVIDADGTVDALDQLDDEAKPSEEIWVYRLEGEPTRMHVCRRGPGRGCSSVWHAEYRQCPQQPDEAVRDNAAWQAWVGELVVEMGGAEG
jgi:hypothetical protein